MVVGPAVPEIDRVAVGVGDDESSRDFPQPTRARPPREANNVRRRMLQVWPATGPLSAYERMRSEINPGTSTSGLLAAELACVWVAAAWELVLASRSVSE